ncbi:2-amino-4-hydroxy-6-hydroxymethyldihydropteridine diphosphokinase [Bacillus timonensis]|nr:2-amino-4-hydroxy-6-hydroxymethyldihydropteridine diphosphokinase [Bacillus timonensis]
MDNTAYIALGSNIGDRALYLKQAIELFDQQSGIEVISCSSIYETDPVGYTDQEQFLNMVIKVKTIFRPLELLRYTQQFERLLGRIREEKWGPRTLDLDILLYNYENIEAEQLIIPHPRMTERAFVLIPLYEIDRNIKIPHIEKPISLLIQGLQDREGVHVWKQKNGEDVFGLFES